ncbi:PTS transporter subunit EIIC [Caulobacter segnis]
MTAGLIKDHADLASAAYKAKALAKLSVPIGILSGVIAGLFYNRFSGFKLPEYLAFFSGRRFVPIVSGLAGLVMAVLIGGGYDAINGGVDAASRGHRRLGRAGPAGLRVLEPHPDRHRPAPHPQQHRLVRGGGLPWRHGRPAPLLCGRSRRWRSS